MKKSLSILILLMLSMSIICSATHGDDEGSPSGKSIKPTEVNINMEKTSLTVENPATKQLTLKIYDTNGLLIEARNSSKDKIKVRFDDYTPGRYYYTLSNKLGIHKEGRFSLNDLLCLSDLQPGLE